MLGAALTQKYQKRCPPFELLLASVNVTLLGEECLQTFFNFFSYVIAEAQIYNEVCNCLLTGQWQRAPQMEARDPCAHACRATLAHLRFPLARGLEHVHVSWLSIVGFSLLI